MRVPLRSAAVGILLTGLIGCSAFGPRDTDGLGGTSVPVGRSAPNPSRQSSPPNDVEPTAASAASDPARSPFDAPAPVVSTAGNTGPSPYDALKMNGGGSDDVRVHTGGYIQAGGGWYQSSR